MICLGHGASHNGFQPLPFGNLVRQESILPEN
jgi:hypothetical protein